MCIDLELTEEEVMEDLNYKGTPPARSYRALEDGCFEFVAPSSTDALRMAVNFAAEREVVAVRFGRTERQGKLLHAVVAWIE